MEKFKLNDFILKAKTIHGDKYDYSITKYRNITSKVKIICPIHGEVELVAREHLYNKIGCPKCYSKFNDIELVINEANLIHGDKYDYSLVNYINKKTKVKIICPIHGEFEQLLHSHVNNKQGCPKCSGNKRLTTNDFIEKAKTIHGTKYDYSLVEYVNNLTKVKIICPIHGEFEQSPSNHLIGRGCKICGNIKLSEFRTKTSDEFISEANKIHNNKYIYNLTEYIDCKNKVKIICPVHGEFEQTPDAHINGKQGCPKCSTTNSQPEEEINDFIFSLGIETVRHDKKILNGKELDILIPSHNIAIEFDGLYWHSELYVSSDYHLSKTNLCIKNGIQLIHIFEDEWMYRKEIVKSRLKNILGLTENKVFARKCEVKEIPPKIAKSFLNNNHIQGYTNSNIKLGLYHNNNLVSVMLFNKPRKGIGNTVDGYELSRFASKLDINVLGGASKLFKYFISNYSANNVISYADRRWSNGNLYDKLGFTLKSINRPTYWYIFNNKRKHRLLFRKQLLIKDGYDKNLTEHSIMLNRKIFRIYDCGTKTYILKL
jgi:hypothetical protein